MDIASDMASTTLNSSTASPTDTIKPANKSTSPAPEIELPERYYRDNFLQVLEFTQQRYSDLLTDEEQDFINDFCHLAEEAQCIYVRLLLRRGDWFRPEKLSYSEISDLAVALDQAAKARFLKRVTDPAELLVHIDEWLTCFTKQECWQAFPDLAIAKSSRRAELDQAIIDYLNKNPHAVLELAQKGLICVYGEQELDILTLLYFGNRYQDLTEFVLRDLGIYQYTDYSLSVTTRWCQSRSQLQAHLDISDVIANYPAIAECDAGQLQNLYQELQEFRCYPSLIRRIEKLEVSIARQLERLQELDTAVTIYELNTRMPARERRCRIETKQKADTILIAWLSQLEEDDCHPEEQEFFRQFIPRQKILANYTEQIPGWMLRPSAEVQQVQWTLSTSSLQAAKSLESRCLFDVLENPDEQDRAAFLLDQFEAGYYCENVLIPGIFGLYFWDIIFADIEGAFCHPFQTRPRDLYDDDFVTKRQSLIEQRLQLLSQDHLLTICLDVFQDQFGHANDLVIWPALSVEKITLACEKIGVVDWHCFFRCLLQDIRHRRSGLPDLILFSDTSYQLLEVKGPGDQLQKNQRAWFQQFSRHNIPAQVLRVKYSEDNS